MSFDILFLEDDLNTRKMVARSLDQLDDVRVIETSNIHEVRLAAQNNSFDFAILDINLGPNARMGGIEVAKELKTHNDDLPIVAFTAYDSAELHEKAIESGVRFDEWFSKATEWPKRNLIRLVELHSSTIPKLFLPNITLKAALLDYGEKTNEGHLIRSVAIPWMEILREIERDPDFLWKFAKHPRKFEEFIAGAYKRLGWDDVIITPHSGDRGRDIIVSAALPGVGIVQFVDECKAYSPGKAVTAKDVSRLAWVLERDRNVSKGIVTTTSEFAPGVYEEFSELLPGRLELKDGKKLRRWLIDIYREYAF